MSTFTHNRRTYTKDSFVDDTIGSNISRKPPPLEVALSDETTLLEASAITPVLTFPMDTDRDIEDLFAEVISAPTGSGITIDIKVEGTSIFSTLLTIDADELDSGTALVPPVYAAAAKGIAAESKVEVFVTAVGSTSAGYGLKLIIN